MNTEFEAKFPNINHDELRSRLKALGGELVKSQQLYRRVVVHTAEMSAKNAFVRIRDEGDKTTITYKQFDSDTVDGARELEVEVSDFQTAISIFEAAGLQYDVYQESKREVWTLDEAEVVLDEWPWLNTYIEVEGSSETHVRQVVSKLDLLWQNAFFGGVANLYLQQYPHIGQEGIDEINHKWTSIRFSENPPSILEVS